MGEEDKKEIFYRLLRSKHYRCETALNMYANWAEKLQTFKRSRVERTIHEIVYNRKFTRKGFEIL